MERPFYIKMQNKPILVLKPNLYNALIPKIVNYFILYLMIMGFSVGPGAYYLFFRGTDSFDIAFIIIILIIFLIPILIIPTIFSYLNIRKMEYHFFNDRLEYYEGFLTIHKSATPYERITDIVMRKTVWDRIFSTATIGLYTPHGVSVYIRFVQDSDKIYEYLQNKILKS